MLKALFSEKKNAIFVLTVLCLVVFGRVISFEYLDVDDPKHLFENPLMMSPSWEGVTHYWGSGFFSLYIPVTYTVWLVVSWLGQWGSEGTPFVVSSPHIFHALNLFFHIANTVVLFSLLRFWVRAYNAAGSSGWAKRPGLCCQR